MFRPSRRSLSDVYTFQYEPASFPVSPNVYSTFAPTVLVLVFLSSSGRNHVTSASQGPVRSLASAVKRNALRMPSQ